MERELNSARKKLERVHQRRYQTDSEAETDAQSGYVHECWLQLFSIFKFSHYWRKRFIFACSAFQQHFDSYSHKRLPLYRLKGPIINKACTSIIHRPLIHRPEAKRGYSVILTMDPFSDNK